MKLFQIFTAASMLLFLSFICLASLLIKTTDATAPSYRYHFCPNTTTFTPNSTYQANLNLLLSFLTSNSTRDGGFYNTTTGRSPVSEIVFGSFLCRGDLIAEDCRACVETAAREAVQTRCRSGKVAILWYDQCMLRYSNVSFFGIFQEGPSVTLANTGKINDAERFNTLLSSTMNKLVTVAANGVEKFSTSEAVIAELQTLYTLVQCTPDISSSDCNRCLRGAVATLPICCASNQGANVLSPNCNIRYEIYPFYTVTATPPTQSPPPVLAPRTAAVYSKGYSRISGTVIVAICAPIAVVLLLMAIACCLLKRRKTGRDEYDVVAENDQSTTNEITTVESLQYDLNTIQTATKNFSDENKIGEGGFGVVYKGALSNGKEIAVKRLSKYSLQGIGEFKNEVLLVAKLQHRNLARLLGFCLEGEEKLLIYEFVPNKSLDYFLFDNLNDRPSLDWVKRYKIIGGIARGILYLHEDSRLRIIHRDLKTSNILLDEQLNPKISDFGLAKICGVDQTQGNTSRIVGTYGYMSPEYAYYGQFSVKSDVFSFGVLVIEIITGKKCTTFLSSESDTEDLLSFAWKHWRDGTTMELLDRHLKDKYTANEVIRCVHIGLLCVQEDPAERPTMANIVLMLSSYSVSLALPKKPAFFPHTRMIESIPGCEPESNISASKSITINDMSISEMYPR